MNELRDSKQHGSNPSGGRVRDYLNLTLPFAVSLALHLAVILLGMTLVWSVTYIRRDLSHPVSVSTQLPRSADFLPDAVPETQPDIAREAELAQLPDQPLPEPDINEEIIDNTALVLPAEETYSPQSFSPPAENGTVRFAGVAGEKAQRICYVLDASGSMRLRMNLVINELMRSVDRLTEEQRFTVILFQRDEALVPPFAGRNLLAPTRKNKDELARWLGSVTARGSSSPLRALELAASLRPDTVFILSNNITGSGRFEISQAELIRHLENIDPLNPATGQRNFYIATVQFLDPDPLDTLRVVAQRFGNGKNSYNFISRGEVLQH